MNLYQRQKELAERLQSLKGKDQPTDPALKARMRDLEAEQKELRLTLARLLDDIEDHATRLPDDPKLEPLRREAVQFLKDVRPSGAAEAMADAEAGLGEFSGTRGYASARKAADILEKFVARCEAGGSLWGQGEICLRFQPALSKGLGNTLAQIAFPAGKRVQFGTRGTGLTVICPQSRSVPRKPCPKSRVVAIA